MAKITQVLLAGLLLAFVSHTANAEDRHALVIGNSSYSIGPLDNPRNDAQLMADVLRATGFEVTHHTDLTYRQFQRAVVQFGRDLQAAGEDTVGMVYYAGHAVQTNGENYLVPVDADIADTLDLEIQTLRVATLMKSLEAAGNRLNLVVLDACRNNPFKSISRSASRGLAKVDAPFGTLLAYSTSPGEIATDGTGRNSPYTAALARAMRTPGLPVEQVFKRVRIEVLEKTGNRQIPWESSSLTGDFYFLPEAPVAAAPAPAPVPESNSRDAEVEYWKSIANATDPTLFESYLSVYPDGLFVDIARQRVDSLTAQREAAAQQQAAQQRQAMASQAWQAVKDSEDPALVRSVIDQYPDTVYAQLAQVKLQSIQSRSQVAAVTPSVDDGERERLFWQSIQNSTERSDYRAYLDRFPDGTFAAIARNRAENGYQPQTAALGNAATAAHPYDGRWMVTWKVVGGYYNAVRWCAAGEKGTTEVEIRNGEFDGTLRSNFSGTAYVKIKIDEGGGVRFHARVPGWSVGTIANNFTIEGDGFDETLKSTGYCRAELAMRRK
ncbi:MAG: caspase family protein [Alphaproteobacteria bacterium]|nr:caspase family protein [Alphaproteobacteria bacterium]